MENLPRALPFSGPFSDDDPTETGRVETVMSASDRTASGIWSIEGDRLVSIEDFETGPAIVLVRSEHVLMLTVKLPPMANMARRLAALPFAIEDRIADPLDDVHVALGREVAPGTWLVGVVRHDLMRQWLFRLGQAGIDRAALVPDALSLPVPGPATWSIDLAADRAMVRAGDATGFAIPQALLRTAWTAAGSPDCVAYGDPLPPDMHGAQISLEDQPLAGRLLASALDLRQGRYALPRRRADPLWKRLAMIAALGALAHGVIAAADTFALQHIATLRVEEARSLAGATQPSLVIGPDPSATLADMTPDTVANQPSQFLSLMSRVGGALAPIQPAVGWRSAAFDRQARTLTLEIEASDIAGLQSIAQALTAAGLTAQQGAASTDQGHAVGTFTVRAL